MAIDPINNPGAWKDLRVGGRAFPGKILAIRGLESTEEWTTTRAIAGQGWTQVHRGRVPIDKIEIDCGLNGDTKQTEAGFWIAWFAFVVFVRGAKPPLPKKPPTLETTGASFKGAGVLKVVYSGHVEPIFTTGRNFGTLRFKEAAKSTPWPAEVPEPAILDASNPTPGAGAETLLFLAASETYGPGPGAKSAATISEQYPGTGAWGKPQ